MDHLSVGLKFDDNWIYARPYAFSNIHHPSICVYVTPSIRVYLQFIRWCAPTKANTLRFIFWLNMMTCKFYWRSVYYWWLTTLLEYSTYGCVSVQYVWSILISGRVNIIKCDNHCCQLIFFNSSLHVIVRQPYSHKLSCVESQKHFLVVKCLSR